MAILPRVVYRKPSFEPLALGYGPRCRACGEDQSTRANPDQLCPRCLLQRYGIVAPDDVAGHINPLQGADPDWSGYWMEYVGFEIPGIPDDDRPIIAWEDHVLELRLLRAWRDGAAVAVVQQWDPVNGYQMSYTTKDPRYLLTRSDLPDIRRLRRFMMHHVKTSGRPALEDERLPVWQDIATQAEARKRKNPRHSWPMIAGHFNVGERTLREYRKRLRE